jgi:hypothetical protein
MKIAFAALTVAVTILFVGAGARAEVVVLQSGFDEQNAVPWNYGQPDVGLTYITTGTANLGFANTFTAADFAAAQAGPDAYTKAPLVIGNFQVYVPSLFAPYPLAQWVNIVPDLLVARTMLYAMPFQLSTTNVTSGSLSMKWAVDDYLGDPLSTDPNPVGVYINGQPVPAAISGGTFTINTTATDPNIGPLLQTGQNWIYFYQRDINAGASGLMFGATITVAPEPATLTMLFIGPVAMCFRRCRTDRTPMCFKRVPIRTVL